MKLKLDAQGNVATKEVNGVKLPVYVHDDGTEKEFDASGTMATITRLNGEAKAHREAKEAAELKLAAFKDIPDPKTALEAMAKLKTIDLTKLVDAGKVDEVRAEVAKVMQGEIDKLKSSESGLQAQVYQLMVGGAFSRSKLIGDKPGQLAIPVDLAQARFGSNFKVEDGKIVAFDASGNKLYSKVRGGELADFEEGLALLVDAYPHKDSILRGAGGSGGGAGGSRVGAGGKKVITRVAFDAMDPVAQRAALTEHAQVVDG